jgi:hypothetical protein
LDRLVEQRNGCGDNGDRRDPRIVLGNIDGIGYVRIMDDGGGVVVGNVHLGVDESCKHASGDERCSHGCRSEIVVVRIKISFNNQYTGDGVYMGLDMYLQGRFACEACLLRNKGCKTRGAYQQNIWSKVS